MEALALERIISLVEGEAMRCREMAKLQSFGADDRLEVATALEYAVKILRSSADDGGIV